MQILYWGGLILSLVFVAFFFSKQIKQMKALDDSGIVPDPTQEQIDESVKQGCSTYRKDKDNFMSSYKVVPMMTDDMRKKGYVFKDVTASGIPYYCLIRKPTSKDDDNTGQCDETKPYYYDFGHDTDKIIQPRNFNDDRPETFGDYYFKENDGKIMGMTPDEAAMECYREKNCGTVYLPSCERGYKFVSKKTLNEKYTGAELVLDEKADGWAEADLLMSGGKWQNHACVRIDKDKAEAAQGKMKPTEVESSMGDLLDFSDVRSLNYSGKSHSSARNVYYFKKGASTDSITTAAGAAGKEKSTNKLGDYTLIAEDVDRDLANDYAMIQYWTGRSKGQKYTEFPLGLATPCMTINKMTPEVDKERCEKAIPGWNRMDCAVRQDSKRVV
jgi:hypothetical protein